MIVILVIVYRGMYEFLWTTKTQDFFRGTSNENCFDWIRVPRLGYRFELEFGFGFAPLSSTDATDWFLDFGFTCVTSNSATFVLSASVILARSRVGIKFEFIWILIYSSACRFSRSQRSTVLGILGDGIQDLANEIFWGGDISLLTYLIFILARYLSSLRSSHLQHLGLLTITSFPSRSSNSFWSV